jgi:hypothetical protein
MIHGQQTRFQIQGGYGVYLQYNVTAFCVYRNFGNTFDVMKETNPVTTGYDVSFSWLMHKNHSIQAGLGQYQNGRKITGTFYDDSFTYSPYYNATAYYYFYQLYALYDLRIAITEKIGVHLSNGMMWLHNRNKAEIFYVPVLDDSFAYIGKTGLTFQIAKPVYVEFNAIFIKGINNILTENSTGEYRHSAIGTELRVGYRW